MNSNLGYVPSTPRLDAACEAISKAACCFLTRMELDAFLETRTFHDGKRLANAIRHIEMLPELADELEHCLGTHGEPHHG